MMTRPSWGPEYPDRALLRAEIDAMTRAVLAALQAAVPAGVIMRVTRKGSASKTWDTPLDYVPEISDVDLHVRLHDDADEARYFSSVESMLRIRGDIERRYREAVPAPVHTPRPQIIIANRKYTEEGFVPAPPWTVETVLGEEGEEGKLDRNFSRESSRRQLLEHEEFLQKLPMSVIDKPGPLLLAVLRGLTWRVGPTGPRVLEVSGASYEEAWGGNRTTVTRLLAEHGEGALAQHYTAFYLAGWAYFLSGFADDAALQEAVLAGARVVAGGQEVGRNVR